MSESSISVDSPVGRLLLSSNGVALTRVHFVDQPESASDGPEPDDIVMRAADQLADYFDRRSGDFDLPLAPAGTPFQQRVWAQLRSIPFGATASYGDVTARLGMDVSAARAVGLANGANPIAIIVPCHRVIGSNGTLVGYAGGLHRKRFLLDLEAATVQEPLFAD